LLPCNQFYWAGEEPQFSRGHPLELPPNNISKQCSTVGREAVARGRCWPWRQPGEWLVNRNELRRSHVEWTDQKNPASKISFQMLIYHPQHERVQCSCYKAGTIINVHWSTGSLSVKRYYDYPV